ncbi:MAG: helix-turn-helix transcriptional regulator [Clostridia bacterium]|nr:helix-turn-helix transcriptional regulator [Clostridia bacterium]
MQICRLEDLNKINISVRGITAIRQVPEYRSLEITGRVHNGLMIVERGSCVYQWGEEQVTLQEGACIYLPYGSCHQMVEHTDDFVMIRLNFAMYNSRGEPVHFSEGPMVICAEPDRILMLTVNRMVELFTTADHSFLRKACFYELLDRMVRLNSVYRREPIRDAVTYIRNHYTEDFSCAELAEICYMSPAQMYRHFKSTLSCTPTEYKNQLRIDQAKSMLRNDSISIGEIAFLMGFESTAYFCKIFKRYTGKTPLQYRKEKRL